MIHIGPKQLFSIILLAQIGTTPLFALGIGAKQDAWIVILFSLLGGFAMLWIFLKIQRLYPEKNWIEILIESLGKWLGIPLVIFYAINWNHNACFNLREFGDLLNLTALPNTPIFVILAVFMFISIYIVWLGLEVFGRTSEFMLPVLLFFIIFTFGAIYFSGEMDFHELLPILEKGFTPVLKAAHPKVISFPFGETIVLLMYWKFVHPKQSIAKISYWAVGISGLLLTISLIQIISVLGPSYAANATIPLLNLIRLIHIGETFTHFDALATLIIFIGTLFKMIFFFYAAVLAICTLFNIKNEKWVICILGLFNVIYCTFFFTSIMFHRTAGANYNTYITPIFSWTLPLMILIIIWLKQWNQKIK